MRKLRFGLAGAAILVLAAIAVALIFTNETNDSPWLTATFAVTAGVSFVAAGPRGALAPAGERHRLPAGRDRLRLVPRARSGSPPTAGSGRSGSASGNLAFVVFLALILAYPSGTLDRRERWLVAVPGAIAIGANTAVALVVDQPLSEDRPSSSAIALTNRPGWGDAIDLVSTVVVVPFLLAVIVILVPPLAARLDAAAPPPAPGLRQLRARALAAHHGRSGRLDQRDRVHGRLALLPRRVRGRAALVPLGRAAQPACSGSRRRDCCSRWTQARSCATRSRRRCTTRRSRSCTGSRRPHGGSTRRAGRRAADRVTRSLGDRRSTATGRVSPPSSTTPRSTTSRTSWSSVAAAAALFLQNERLQAELRAQYAFLETIANTAPSLLVVVDPGRPHPQPEPRHPDRERPRRRGADPRPLLLGRVHRPRGARGDAGAIRGRCTRLPRQRVREHVHERARGAPGGRVGERARPRRGRQRREHHRRRARHHGAQAAGGGARATPGGARGDGPAPVGGDREFARGDPGGRSRRRRAAVEPGGRADVRLFGGGRARQGRARCAARPGRPPRGARRAVCARARGRELLGIRDEAPPTRRDALRRRDRRRADSRRDRRDRGPHGALQRHHRAQAPRGGRSHRARLPRHAEPRDPEPGHHRQRRRARERGAGREPRLHEPHRTHGRDGHRALLLGARQPAGRRGDLRRRDRAGRSRGTRWSSARARG